MSALENVCVLGIIRRPLVYLLLALGIALDVGFAQADDPSAVATTEQPVIAFVQRPHTDGSGLLAKPAPFTEAESEKLFAEGKLACESACTTPFGEVLGEADGAKGRSNCVPTCIRPEYSFLNLESGEVTVHSEAPKNEQLHYIGVTYQCVEYARKWWMINHDITFGSIDSAHEIIYLTEGAHIRTKETFPLARSVNGTAQRPPKRGDLVVYYPDRENPEWKHGHVAVVVDTDLEAGTVALAEENYDNEPWQDPKAFARQIRLFKVGGRYMLLDVPAGGTKNEDGGLISGWIYPLSKR